MHSFFWVIKNKTLKIMDLKNKNKFIYITVKAVALNS